MGCGVDTWRLAAKSIPPSLCRFAKQINNLRPLLGVPFGKKTTSVPCSFLLAWCPFWQKNNLRPLLFMLFSCSSCSCPLLLLGPCLVLGWSLVGPRSVTPLWDIGAGDEVRSGHRVGGNCRSDIGTTSGDQPEGPDLMGSRSFEGAVRSWVEGRPWASREKSHRVGARARSCHRGSRGQEYPTSCWVPWRCESRSARAYR